MRQKIGEKQSAETKLPQQPLDMVDNTVMDILLDMSSLMQVMEEYVVQQHPFSHSEIRALFWI